MGDAPRDARATAWIDRDFIDAHTTGFEAGRRSRCEAYDPRPRRDDRPACPPDAIEQAARAGRRRPSARCSCTPAASSTSPRASRTAWRCINLALATGKIGREGRGLRDDHRPGQRPGRARARPEVRPAPGQRAHRRIPSTASTSRGSGASRRRSIPQAGLSAQSRSWRRSTAARSRALLSICFNPLVSLPDADFIARGARQARVLRRRSTSSCPRPRSHADVVLPGTLQEEDEGVVAGRGPGHQDQQGGRPAGRGAAGLADLSATWRARLGQGQLLPVRDRRARSSTSCAWPRAAASPTTPASPTSRSTTRWASSGPARATGPPRHAAPLRGRTASTTPTARPASTSRRVARQPAEDGRRRVSRLPHHRPGGQPVPLGHADPAHRPAGRPVPRAALEMHPRLAEQLGIADGDWVTVETPARRDHRPARMVVTHDPARHGVHPVPLGRATRAPTS